MAQTRDELIERLKQDYKADDKIVGLVWGWDSTLEFLDDYPEEVSTLPISQEEFARQVWDKCRAEVESLVDYVLNSRSTEIIDEAISEAVSEELEKS